MTPGRGCGRLGPEHGQATATELHGRSELRSMHGAEGHGQFYHMASGGTFLGERN